MDRIELTLTTSAQAPMHVADKRPTADVAAMNRDPRPHVPMPVGFVPAPISPSLSQTAAVSRSLMLATGVEEQDKTRAIPAAPETERTLKPYGIRMLPDGQDAATGGPRSQQEPTPPTS